MRTCKALHTTGLAVFKLNWFILGSTTAHPRAFTEEAQNHNTIIWTKTQKLKNFKHFKLRLHFTSPSTIFSHGSKVNTFFLLCLKELDQFLLIIRSLTYGEPPKLKFLLRLEGATQGDTEPLSIKQQRALLSPFEKVIGTAQKCTVTGAVDGKLAKRIESRVSPTVFWTRAQCRDFLDILKQLMLVARAASLQNQHKAAHHIYHNLIQYFESPGRAGKVFSHINSGEDTALQLYFAGFSMQVQYGLILANLWFAHSGYENNLEKLSKNIIEATSLHFTAATIQMLRASGMAPAWPTESMWLQLRAMGYIGLQQYGDARRDFDKAAKLDASNPSHSSQSSKCAQAAQMTSISADMSFKLFKDFMTSLPTVPPRSTSLPPSIIAGADQERYTLRAHGYTGPMYEHKIIQKPGTSLNVHNKEVHKPFIATAFHKTIAASIARYEECRQKGTRPPDVFVGPGSETGLNGMLKAFRSMQMQNRPHPMANRDGRGDDQTLSASLHMVELLNTYGVTSEELQGVNMGELLGLQ